MFHYLHNINLNSFYNLENMTNNFKTHYIKYIIIFLIIFSFVSIILFIIISYFILKFLKLNIDDNNILFYQYNKKSKKLLDLYGEHKLTKIYLVRQPFSKTITFLLNIATLYNYEKLINESRDNFPYHTLLVFEIELENGIKKLLLLEKNNCINISENFLINKTQEIKELNIKHKNYTINHILNTTQERLGNNKFFNWHFYKNNCQEFIKEILKTLGKYNRRNKKFIFHDKIVKFIFPSEFTLHIGNCVCVIYNILEKYIYDSNILN